MTDDSDDMDFSEPTTAREDELEEFFAEAEEAATDGGEAQDEDDPWAGVKSEDELKRTATEDDTTNGEDEASSALTDSGSDTTQTSGGDEDDEGAFVDRLAEALREEGWTFTEYADEAGLSITELDDIVNAGEPVADEEKERLLSLARREGERATDDAAARPERPDVDWAEDGGYEEGIVNGEFIAEDVSCENCQHRDVCVILNSFVPMLRDENWDAGTPEDGSPVDPMDMAKICDSYAPEDDDRQPGYAEAPDGA